MKKAFITGSFILLVVFSFTSCFHKETFQKIDGFQTLDFRGNYCYYIANDYFIIKANGNCYLEWIDNTNHDDIIIYEGAFLRFCKINQNYVAIENLFELDGKKVDEYALIFLPDTFHRLKDAKIQKVYDDKDFMNLLAQKNLETNKWEKA